MNSAWQAGASRAAESARRVIRPCCIAVNDRALPCVSLDGEAAKQAIHPIPTRLKGTVMKKVLLVALTGLSLAAGAALAREVRDWKDLHRAHEQIQQVIHELERARAANHYDMAGHGARAEELLRQAEHELHEAIEAAKGEK